MASPTRILAGPSEVLVSQTVRDLVAGSGLTFKSVGEHEEWHPPTAGTSLPGGERARLTERADAVSYERSLSGASASRRAALPCPVVRWEAPLSGHLAGGRYRASASGEASHDAELSELVNIRSKNRYRVSALATGPTA